MPSFKIKLYQKQKPEKRNFDRTHFKSFDNFQKFIPWKPDSLDLKIGGFKKRLASPQI